MTEPLLPASWADWSRPPIPAPAGTRGVERDTCANYWALADGGSGGGVLWVLPTQAPSHWVAAAIPGWEAGNWDSLMAGADGLITLTRGREAASFDPRRPEAGLRPARMDAATPTGSCPWRIATRMPASNHDLTAAVLQGRMYVAGGITADWGYPSRSHAFAELWELDVAHWNWRTVARFTRPRIYCATAAWLDQIWIIGGDVLAAGDERRPSRQVQRFDPATGRLAAGPDLPVDQPAPLALVAQGRLFVMGAADRQSPGRMDSLGPGETAWRREPDGPPHMWALAGAVLDERLYVAVPGIGLAVFDPRLARWRVLAGSEPPVRSAQVAAWRGEIWLISGRDIPDPRAVRIYQPETGRWRVGPAFPRELAWGAAAVVHDTLIVTGGAAGPGYNDRTFVLRPEDDPPRW